MGRPPSWFILVVFRHPGIHNQSDIRLTLLVNLAVLVFIAIIAAFILRERRLRNSGRSEASQTLFNIRLSDLWRWDGRVDRGTYALIGLVGFALKHNLDRLTTSRIFDRPWGLFNYWIPPGEIFQEEPVFLVFMLTLSQPFMWVGVVLTLRRLRAVKLPLALVVVFFLPLVNLAFFVLLSVLPSRQKVFPETASSLNTFLDKVIPRDPWGSAAISLLIITLVGVAATVVAVLIFGEYGWSLFVGLPFCLGLGSVLIYSYHSHRDYLSCLLVATLATLFLSLALVAVAIEGILCVAMAAPIAWVLAVLGASIGYLIQKRPLNQIDVPPVMLSLFLFLPSVMVLESVTSGDPVRVAVHTSISIQASPEQVWENLISFPRLEEPKEWLFRLGVSYPILATIEGEGVGAVRRCLFSTGTFVEPIEVWEEFRLLRFSVLEQAPPLQELSPYGDMSTPHLTGYFHPERAQFTLTPLPQGGTQLEGISWYRNDIWPATYWRWWSDWMVHKIHLRVFEHIKRLAEES